MLSFNTRSTVVSILKESTSLAEVKVLEEKQTPKIPFSNLILIWPRRNTRMPAATL